MAGPPPGESDERPSGRAILLTPPGAAAIAVVRLAGPGVGPFLARHFSRPAAEGRCVHGVLSDGARTIDDPVVVLSAGGRVADVNLHGGPWVVRSVLELARRAGFNVAERPDLPVPPEAVDGETELRREVLCYLPLARTELAARVLLAQEVAWGRFRQSSPTKDELEAVLADQSLHWLLHPPRVALVGVPNAGKSTLANQLFAQQRSITADLPGTTRDWVGEIANVDGLAVMLVDTPGVREAADPVEREAIGRAMEVVRGADLVVLVLDPTQPRDSAKLAGLYRDPAAIRVRNKCDLPPARGEGEVDTREVDTGQTYAVSATTGHGVDALRAAIKKRFVRGGAAEPFTAQVWTDRQRLLVEDALTDPSALSRV